MRGINIDLPLLLDGSMLKSDSRLQYYGNISNAFPTGRPKDTEQADKEHYVSLVKKIKEAGHEFNFLLNGDLSVYDIKSFYSYLYWVINEIRPSIITFSDPVVYHHIVKNYDYRNFEISAIVGIKDRLGYERFITQNDIDKNHISKLVFHHDVTIDSVHVVELNKKLKNENISSCVLVTESCYNNCPLRQLHYNSFVDAYRKTEEEYVNHYQVHCISKRLLQPSSLFDLSGFLLPEQIGDYYKATGINSFKISGRSESAEWIYNTAQAYINGFSPDNIFEIIVFTSPFLDEFGLKISDLFYLNAKAYLDLCVHLKVINNKDERQLLIESKANEYFLRGLFRINDPNSVYDVINGKLRLVKSGDYLNLLKRKSNPDLKGTVYYKSSMFI